MNRSITQSPGRYIANSSKIEGFQPVHKTKYFSGKKDSKYGSGQNFEDYDKYIDSEKTNKYLNLMNRENGEYRQEKQFDKEYNSIQNGNGKYKDLKKPGKIDIQEDNERLYKELDEQKIKEQQMSTMIQNQKQQLSNLEQLYKKSIVGKPKPLQTYEDVDNGDDSNIKKQDNILNHKQNSSTRNNTPTNSFRLRKQKYITPTKDYSYDQNGQKMDDWQTRNFTSIEQGTERKKSFSNNKSLLQDQNINPKILKTNEKLPQDFDSSQKKSQVQIPSFDYDSIMPDFDPNVASKDEMSQYIHILKKQFTIQERKYINEIENLRFRIERLEIEKLEIIDQSVNKQAQAQEFESRLKDREKELSMAYMKLKNPEQKLNNSSNAINISGLRDQSRLNKLQSIEPLKGQQTTEDMLIISTHAKLSKITIWSSSDRIQGLTFQYTKPDGTILEVDNSYFFQRNYRYDTFTASEEDQIQIEGKYNIKGVKYIKISSSKGVNKKYKPVGISEEELDSDEAFVIPINRDCNFLKIMFPNIFTYDMKGAKIYDRHHQNFIYAETNRITSLQNAEVIWNREVLDKNRAFRPDPMDGKRSDSPSLSYSVPRGGTQAGQQGLDELNPENAKYYYSDQIDSYKLNEIQDPIDGGKINFSDGELIFMEKRLKIYRVLIWADENYVYGLKFSYITAGGFNLIEGKSHAGIDIQHINSKEVDLSSPEIYLHRIYFYRRDNLYIEKIVFLLSNGQKFSWGKQIPSKDSRECLIELKQSSSYVYGTLIPSPQIKTPSQFVLSNLRVSEIR